RCAYAMGEKQGGVREMGPTGINVQVKGIYTDCLESSIDDLVTMRSSDDAIARFADDQPTFLAFRRSGRVALTAEVVRPGRQSLVATLPRFSVIDPRPGEFEVVYVGRSTFGKGGNRARYRFTPSERATSYLVHYTYAN